MAIRKCDDTLLQRIFHLVRFRGLADADTVIPRELLDRTWAYILEESGALAHPRRDSGGHSLTQQTAVELSAWVQAQLEKASA